MRLPGIVASSKSNGGGGGYTAKAVHFDGNTNLTGSNVAADSGLLTYSLWINTTTLATSPYIFDFDPAGNESGFTFQNDGTAKAFWPHQTRSTSSSGVLSTGIWQHIFGYVNVNLSAGNKIQQVFVDGVDQTGTLHDTFGAFVIAFSSIDIAIPDNTADTAPPWMACDMADVWIAPGVLQTDITIFRNPGTGKPNNPNTFPASAILFSGDHTTFPVNQGSGGAFSLTGSLTDASTHP